MKVKGEQQWLGPKQGNTCPTMHLQSFPWQALPTHKKAQLYRPRSFREKGFYLYQASQSLWDILEHLSWQNWFSLAWLELKCRSQLTQVFNQDLWILKQPQRCNSLSFFNIFFFKVNIPLGCLFFFYECLRFFSLCLYIINNSI